jgi:hypothetical protein
MHEAPRVDDTIDKVAFVVEAASLAKEMIVKDAGIGEDLTFSLYGWRHDCLVAILQMRPEHMWIDKYERFKKLTNVACVLRKAWGIDEFTLVAEGYCSSDPEATRGLELDEAYVTMDEVRSCLTFTHVNEIETAIVTRPYTLTVPRRVVYDENMYFPGQSILRRKDGVIPAMLLRVIDTIEPEKVPEDNNSYFEAITEGLYEEGFIAQWF